MIIVRQAEEKDLPAILDIYNHVILHTTAVYDYEAHSFERRKKWFDEKKEAGHPVFVAEDNGSIVGFSSYGAFRNWQAYKFSVENSVYVDENARGRGIGKLLLEPLIQHARENGLHTMIAGIDASNDASLKLHKSFGFTEAGIFKEVGYKFNRWLDLVFLQLMLTEEKKTTK